MNVEQPELQDIIIGHIVQGFVNTKEKSMPQGYLKG
jgi:hypothetical protein